MEQKKVPVKYGTSLLVPCVQELAKQSISSIPPRYVRPEKESTSIISDETQIPVIDMGNLISEHLRDSEIDKLHSACKDWGFFQLVNHGVSSTLLEKIKTETQKFFNMPMEEKKKYWQFPGEVEGFGQAFVVSEEQKLDWSDMFFLNMLPIHSRKPHLFPKLPPCFRDTLDEYSVELKNLGMALLSNMARALKMDSEEMKSFFEDGIMGVRMNYYPPCPEPEKAIGLTPHSDGGGLTILLQVNEVEGLEIRKNGKWISVKPLPNAFIVNIGDMLEILTNGTYPSIEHRATVNSIKERFSIATFNSTSYEGEVGPASSLITEQRPALFKRMTAQEYLTGLFARSLHGKSFLDSIKIQHGDA
ncbi:hypothetical protein ACFE04_023746 [Oxalis oulophora]